MAKQFTITGIATGQTIEAAQVSQSVQAFTGAEAYDIEVSGSVLLTGSFIQQTGSSANVSNFQLKQVAMNTGSALPGSYGFVAIDSTGLLYSASAAAGSQGATGAQGTTGGNGSQGAVGTQGNTGGGGAQGATGANGSNGSQGGSGAQGTAGSAGSQGETGPVGPQGADGTNGSAGAQGAEGSNGPQGTDGAKGAQGDSVQGVTGNTGAQGAIGAGGPAGSQGATGAGTQGATGTQGADGSQGTDGTKGATGSQGAIGAGTQGGTGTQGTDGQKGQKGEVGTGSQGATGAGSQGETGAQGTNGAQGDTGGTGGAGPQGANGAQGTDGTKGQKGEVGTGTQGAVGTNGPQGTDGSTGSQGAGGAQGAEGSGGGSATIFNTQTRYKVLDLTNATIDLVSTGDYMGGITWARSGTEVTFTAPSHGLATGDVVSARNVGDSNYINSAITFIDTNSFKAGGFTNSGDTSGTEAAYLPCFSASATLNGGQTSISAITITAPGGLSGSAQLNAIKIYTSAQESDIDVTFPVGSLQEGGGFESAAFKDINAMVWVAQGGDGTGQTTSRNPTVKYGDGANGNVCDIGNVGTFGNMIVKGYLI